MTRQELVSAVLQNALTVQGYKNGCDGRGKDHLCDCIGLIIGAFDILGQRWPGTHGTNWTARNYVNGLAEFQSVLDLKLGDVVLKGRSPGQDGYSLPDTYRDDPDRTDYYHIGVVTSMNPFKITHCTTVPGGIQTDQGKKNWKYKATLKSIKDGGGDVPVKKALVYAANGLPVKLRANPSKAATVLLTVKVGEEVDLIEANGEWSKIKYQEVTGYMMSEFLTVVADDVPPDQGDEGSEPIHDEGYVSVRMPEDLAYALWEILDGVVGKG